MLSLKEMNKSLSMSRVVMKSILRQRELWRHNVNWVVGWWQDYLCILSDYKEKSVCLIIKLLCIYTYTVDLEQK